MLAAPVGHAPHSAIQSTARVLTAKQPTTENLKRAAEPPTMLVTAGGSAADPVPGCDQDTARAGRGAVCHWAADRYGEAHRTVLPGPAAGHATGTPGHNARM